MSKQKEYQLKQEGESKSSKFSRPSRPWSSLRNPRIVRIPPSLGGKDRHSKVCTVRGLRDRRIRLSSQTAIQLYDLQYKLDLNQPSKVIDWLLEVTKHDIDKLPPLPLSPGFGQFHQEMLFPRDSTSFRPSQLPPFFDSRNSQFWKAAEEGQFATPKSRYWDADNVRLIRERACEFHRETASGKGKGIGTNDYGGVQYPIGECSERILEQKLLPWAKFSSLPGLLNSGMAENYYSEQLSLSPFQFGNNGGFALHMDGHTSTSSSRSPLFLCPNAAMPTLFTTFPSYITAPVEREQPKEVSPIFSSGSSAVANLLMPSFDAFSSSAFNSFPANANHKFLHSQNSRSRLN